LGSASAKTSARRYSRRRKIKKRRTLRQLGRHINASARIRREKRRIGLSKTRKKLKARRRTPLLTLRKQLN